MLTTRARQYGLIVALAGIAAFGGRVCAQEAPGRTAAPVELMRVALPELEQAFWICDYTATTQRAGAADIGTCRSVYEALKERKFDGDFDRLLSWWEQNKPPQHARLRAAAGSEQLLRLRSTPDQVGRLLGDHDRRRVRIARGDLRHH